MVVFGKVQRMNALFRNRVGSSGVQVPERIECIFLEDDVIVGSVPHGITFLSRKVCPGTNLFDLGCPSEGYRFRSIDGLLCGDVGFRGRPISAR